MIPRSKEALYYSKDLPFEVKKYEKTKTYILLLPIETTGVSFLLGKFNRGWFSFRGHAFFSGILIAFIDCKSL